MESTSKLWLSTKKLTLSFSYLMTKVRHILRLTTKTKHMLRFHATALFTFLFVLGVPIRQKTIHSKHQDITSQNEQIWVDSVFNSMTDDERLGQLFMIRANRKAHDTDLNKKAEELINNYHVGGVCFFKGHPSDQLQLTNHFQAISKFPLMIAIDGEWGVSMRLDSTIVYPHNIALGAIRQNSLIYQAGSEIAKDCVRLGIHVDFAPVSDVNNNPNNPIINDRSFGENKYNVSAKSFMYMLGMQDQKVIACAKHFPGHGDTDVDSHKDLPTIPHSLARLDSLELYPFKVLINQGVKSIMVAHLNIPALDTSKHRPTSLSQNVVTNLLQHKLKFKGLIFTDGLEMKGVTKYFKPGEVEAEAILAGNDILLLPGDTPAAFKTIKQYIADGRLTWERIYESTKKILHAKYQAGLNDYHPKPLAHLYEDLNHPRKKVLKRKLIANALTLARNIEDVVPIKDTKNQKIAVVSIGETTQSTFQKTALKYGNFSYYNTPKVVSNDRRKSILTLTQNKDLVIIGLHDMSRHPSKHFGITPSSRKLIEDLDAKHKVLVVIFGNPYSLKYFESLQNVLVAYQDDDDTQDLAAQALFGANSITGRLPVTASEGFIAGQGVPIKNIQRFGFTIPEAVGVDSKTLTAIDTILDEMIRIKAAPGAQVLIARRGKIIYQKGYGYHTYSQKKPVRNDDIYDLASITKVAATTVSLMKLYDEGLFDINQTLDAYLPEVAGTNKADLAVRDILAHRARLKPWIPFYKETMVSVGRRRRHHRRRKILSKKIYHKKSSIGYSVPVAKGIFMKDSYMDSIWQRIYDSDLRKTEGYRYSDLGFYLFNRVIQNITHEPENVYVKKNIYDKLGLHTMTYLPLNYFDKQRIIPTERDHYFRKTLVQGYVHDMGAAMLGGVSGHAGLFSDSYDLAVLFQMLLNGGTYGGKRILSQDVVHLFTQRVPEDTRRGLGFDLKELAPSTSYPRRKENMSPLASDSTFGHLGFTGTCVWADPDKDLIYIFLSNRTYPSMHNGKLNRANIRPRIQSVIYKALLD